jgi:two-component system sensor histidine kinase KdpD
MSRLEAGALSVELLPTALDEVVGRALVGLPADRIEVRVPDDLPLAHADPGLLERVVANLADNALRHEPPESRVRIDATHVDDERLQLSVVDHGPGLDEKYWDGMFAPFQRFDDHGVGTGLGLAIARGFTTAMDALLVPSHTPGGGLTMTVTVRVAP